MCQYWTSGSIMKAYRSGIKYLFLHFFLFISSRTDVSSILLLSFIFEFGPLRHIWEIPDKDRFNSEGVVSPFSLDAFPVDTFRVPLTGPDTLLVVEFDKDLNLIKREFSCCRDIFNKGRILFETKSVLVTMFSNKVGNNLILER